MVTRRLLGGIVLAIGAAGCGQAHPTAKPHDPAAVIRLLEHEGYKPPEVPKPPPGNTSIAGLSVRFDARYGKPVAYLEKGGLDVMVARGTSTTPRFPEALWLRTGSAIVLGYPRSHAGIAQWGELAKTL